jgi:enterochelin esterase-like enzyme
MQEVTIQVTGERKIIASAWMNRGMIVDIYIPHGINLQETSLLLLNDGQNGEELQLASMLEGLLSTGAVNPFLTVGIHAGDDRKNVYGTARILDYEGRGARAGDYNRFILHELLPFIEQETGIRSFKQKAFAGFSLGGLSAMDLVWHHPEIFSIAGVFSGSLWWRSKSLEEDYNDDTDRIMHQQVRNGCYQEGLRFYFTTGSLDETADRNQNGIIDSIDDTLALVEELKELGYREGHEIMYVNYEDGRHNIATWARALPPFLQWAWGR